ncbi:hypothetical protein MDAP_000855 [Mitosporidium daphniae]
MHKEKAKILHNHKFKLKRELAQAKKIFGIPQEPGNHADALKNVKDNNKKAKSDPLYEAKKNSDLRRREKQEIQHKRIKRKQEIEDANVRRTASHLLCTSRTKKGQPVMRDRIKHLLEKLQ